MAREVGHGGGDYSREAIILNIFIKRGRLFEEYGSSEGHGKEGKYPIMEQPHLIIFNTYIALFL